jgi:hypothetical protein
MNVRKWISIPDYVQSSEEFQAAWEFQRTFEPMDGIDYSWIPEYAKAEYANYWEALKALDDKADKLIQYMGAGTGFVALFSIYAKEGAQHVWAIAPAAVLLLISLALAVIARAPQAHHYPPFTSEAILYAEAYDAKDKGRIEFMAKFAAASVALKVAGQYKAVHLRWAFRFFVLALAYLVLAVSARL